MFGRKAQRIQQLKTSRNVWKERTEAVASTLRSVREQLDDIATVFPQVNDVKPEDIQVAAEEIRQEAAAQIITDRMNEVFGADHMLDAIQAEVIRRQECVKPVKFDGNVA